MKLAVREKKEAREMRKGKEFVGNVRLFLAAGLAACMLLGTGIQAEAATLKDVFDEHYYADHNPDLKNICGYDREILWEHYIRYGMKEGRVMNNLLDVVAYRKNNADLDAAFGDDWDAYLNHYLIVGAKEGRDSGREFDPMYYVGRYEDLRQAYGEDVLMLWHHYITFGAAEGRESQAPPVAAGATELETEYAYQVLEIMNKIREQNGLKALLVTQGLMDAAQMRAQELAVFFSHDRPNGTHCYTAYDQNGVNYLAYAENIAYGQSSPEAVMESWMNSPGHRGNILNAPYDYHYVGIGCYITDRRIYWSQNFMN